MDNKSLKEKEMQPVFPVEDNRLGETLDFTELICLKGGKEDEKDSGNAGGLFCWC